MWSYGGLGKYAVCAVGLALPFVVGGCTTAERAEKTYPVSQRGIDVLFGSPIYRYAFSVKMRLETLEVLRKNPEKAEDHIIACLKEDLKMFEMLRKTYRMVSEQEKKEIDGEIDECERNIHKALTEK